VIPMPKNIKNLVREGYNKAAEGYLATRNNDLPEMKLLPDFVSRIESGSRILDAGCGAGYPVTKYLSESFETIGVDISEEQIKLAKENVPKAQFLCQDMTKINFPDEYFGGILSYYAIFHIPRDEHYDLLKNFYRMLKPNGIALLVFSMGDDPGYINEDFFGATMYWNSWTNEKYLTMLTEIGFKIIWNKNIDDSIGDYFHMFVLLEK
jgi:ubiquinone/menaquinone biosynthesis C-methylase UbiE